MAKRKAKLVTKRTQRTYGLGYLSLVASNGKKLMTSEVYDTTGNAKRAREDVLAAMIEVLEHEGYSVTACQREEGR